MTISCIEGDKNNKLHVNRAILMKMSLERHQSYISAAYAMMNLCQHEKSGHIFLVEALSHILDLMNQEIKGQEGQIEAQVAEILERNV